LLPPTGGRGVGMAPSLTGRGWGWVGFSAAEAVSQFPGPPLEDPPTSPPRHSTGARGGSAVGRLAHGLPPPHGRRSVAADVPARLAQRLQRSRPVDHEQRRLCGRRATKRSDWRGGRAGPSTPDSGGPAPGVAGVRGGDLGRAQRTGAERSAAQCVSIGAVRQARERIRGRSGTPDGPQRDRDPRPRDGPPSLLCRHSRPDRHAAQRRAVRARDGSPVGSRHRYSGGSMRSTTARPREAGCAMDVVVRLMGAGGSLSNHSPPQ